MPSLVTKTRDSIYQLLRWIEKYTKTDMVYLAKGGLWLTVSKVVGIFTSLALSIAFANMLSKESYGVYKYIISFAGILSIPTLVGMNDSLSRSIAKGYEGSLWSVIKTKIRWGIIGIAGGLALAGYYFYQENYLLGLGFLVIALLSPIMDSVIMHGAYLQGKKKFKLLSILNSISQVTTVAAIIIALIFSKNVPLIILSSYGTNFTVRGLAFLYTLRRYPPNNKIDSSTIAFGKHLSVMQIFSGIVNNIDKILMWHLVGPVELAVYSFALAPVNQGKSFLRSLTTLAFPKLAQQDPKILRQTLLPKIARLCALMTIFVAAYILLAPYLYRVLFPSYMDAILYTRYYALYIFLFPLSLVGSTFVAQGQHRYLYILRTATPAVKIGLLLILLPLFGIAGAIASLLVATAFNSMLAMYLFLKPQTTHEKR